MKNGPLVSIVMPTYNSELYIKESVESILNQTYSNFELIIIDGYSTDSTEKIISSFRSDKIRFYKQKEKGSGLACALNDGISTANGEFIARMDADDISFSNRIEQQTNYLLNNGNIAVCGTCAKPLETTIPRIRRYPLNPNVVKCCLLFESLIVHPSVMFNRNILKNDLIYDISFKYCEDYELWTRLTEKYDIGNIGEILIGYRLTKGSASRGNYQKHLEFNHKVISRQLNKLNIYPSNEQINLHKNIVVEKSNIINELIKIEEWLLKLIQNNQNYSVYPEPYFTAVIKNRWRDICITYLSSKSYQLYSNSKLSNGKMYYFNSPKKIIHYMIQRHNNSAEWNTLY